MPVGYTTRSLGVLVSASTLEPSGDKPSTVPWPTCKAGNPSVLLRRMSAPTPLAPAPSSRWNATRLPSRDKNGTNEPDIHERLRSRGAPGSCTMMPVPMSDRPASRSPRALTSFTCKPPGASSRSSAGARPDAGTE